MAVGLGRPGLRPVVVDAIVAAHHGGRQGSRIPCPGRRCTHPAFHMPAFPSHHPEPDIHPPGDCPRLSGLLYPDPHQVAFRLAETQRQVMNGLTAVAVAVTVPLLADL